MNLKLLWKGYALTLLFVAFSSASIAQVGINTHTISDGALLDIVSANKGFLLPRVALTDTGDVTTITPAATTGLLVYNTATSGTLPFQVTPGIYYWNGSQWLRFYNRGYSIKFDQTAPVTLSSTSSTWTAITGLDTGSITVPYSGTYIVKVETAYAAGTLISTTSDGVGQASVRLTMATNGGSAVNVKEVYVTSCSKRISSTATTINGLPRNVSIVYTVDLDVMDTYQFAVDGREWSTSNVGQGQIGKDTSVYTGATGITNAQEGTISLTLVRQQ